MDKIEQDLTKRFVLRNIAGKSFLIPLNRVPQRLISLNSTAAYIWKNLHAGYTVAECAKTISSKFKVPKRIVRSDIKKFFYKIRRGLIREIDIKDLNKSLKVGRIPIQGSIELTGRCNLNCFHCYARGERDKAELQFQEIKKLINQLVKNGCLFLQLTGGECLSRRNFKEIYLYIRRAGIIPTISTNATLFNNDLIGTMTKYPPYCVIVSLYGAKDSVHDRITQTKGSFKKTLTNVIRLKNRGISVRFSAVVFKENFSEVQKMRKLAERIDIPIVFYPFLIPALNKDVNPLSHGVEAEECVQILALNKKKKKLFRNEALYPCNAGLQSFHIDCGEEVYLCKIERSIGFSLLEASFKDSWRRLARIRALKLRLPQNCLDCKQKATCEVCPPMMRLYESSGCGRIYCQRAKIKQDRHIST